MDELGRPRCGDGAGEWGEDTGAALVEMAMVLVLLVMLLVGIVSAGIAYNNQLALTHSAREGGRYAATLPVNPGTVDDWLATVINQTVADATGTLDPGVDGRYVCVAYVHPNGTAAGDTTTRRILDSGGLQASQGGQQCFAGGDGRPDDERRVQVVVRRNTDFSVVFFSSDVNLDAEAVNRFEAALGS